MGKNWFIENINKIDKMPNKQNHKREDKLLMSEMKYYHYNSTSPTLNILEGKKGNTKNKPIYST